MAVVRSGGVFDIKNVCCPHFVRTRGESGTVESSRLVDWDRSARPELGHTTISQYPVWTLQDQFRLGFNSYNAHGQGGGTGEIDTLKARKQGW